MKKYTQAEVLKMGNFGPVCVTGEKMRLWHCFISHNHNHIERRR